MRWYKLITVCIFTCLLSGLLFAAAPSAAELTISAALSLKPPFEALGREYEKRHPGSRVVFNFAASGVLQKQIEAGAPADVFASASSREMDALEGSGLLLAGSRADFAGNAVVLIAAKNASLRISSFSDLNKSDVGRIAIGNPATVPAGKYAAETLRSLELWEGLRPKLVYAEHVRQVMDYTAREEVDAGMVFRTDALSRGSELKIISEAPASSHTPVVYTAAAIKGTKNEAAALGFIALVLSKEGREVLRRHGFMVKTQK